MKIALPLRRTAVLASLVLLGMEAFAQPARPPGAVPLDEPAPPPPLAEADPALEPQVTVRIEDGQRVEEHRVNGKVQMIRVTPRHGRPYVLVDRRGDGTMTRHDNPLDEAIRAPQWVLLEF